MNYHPADRCAWCGNREPDELRPTMHKDTHAPALTCRDPIACIRRQYRERTARELGRRHAA